MKHLMSLGLAFAFGQAATAQDRGDTYLGASVGSFSFEEDEELGLTIDDTTSSYHVIGGYRLSDHFALEGGLVRTEHIKENRTASFVPPGTLNTVKAEFRLLTVRALGVIPFERTSLLGGVGYHEANIQYRASVQAPGQLGHSFEGETSHNGATVMGGFEVNLKRVDIRTQLEWFDFDGEHELGVDDGDAWDFSVGVLFRWD
jgi:hypothetical protein